ncbi:Uncharacterised protein [Moellerella wisconsensis]|nr:Uncharacterised protein [Moellerella wisconsensis]
MVLAVVALGVAFPPLGLVMLVGVIFYVVFSKK